MDLNDYWQENKRFVTSVVLGLVVFLIALQMLAGNLGAKISSANARIRKLQSDENEIVHTAADLADATNENERLQAAVAALDAAVAFVPRPDFIVDARAGSASNQYLRTLSRVREELLLRANRGDLVLDESLGMPKLSPTREEEIVRHLEALDAIDVLVRSAIEARVARIDRIQLRLDPGLSTRAGLGRIERTRITFEMNGDGRALAAVLASTQRGADGRVLPIDAVTLSPSRAKEDEVKLELTLVLPRLAALEGAAGANDGDTEG